MAETLIYNHGLVSLYLDGSGNGRSRRGHYLQRVFSGIQQQPLREVAEFVHESHEFFVDIDSGESVRVLYAQPAERWFGLGQGLERLRDRSLLSGLDGYPGGHFLEARIGQLHFMLARRHRIGPRDFEVGRRAQVISVHKHASASRVCLYSEGSHSLSLGQQRQ